MEYTLTWEANPRYAAQIIWNGTLPQIVRMWIMEWITPSTFHRRAWARAAFTGTLRHA